MIIKVLSKGNHKVFQIFNGNVVKVLDSHSFHFNQLHNVSKLPESQVHYLVDAAKETYNWENLIYVEQYVDNIKHHFDMDSFQRIKHKITIAAHKLKEVEYDIFY